MYKYYVNYFLPSSYNCLLKIYFVNNIIRGGPKVPRGGSENFMSGAKSSPGRSKSPPPRNPALRNSLSFYEIFLLSFPDNVSSK